MSEHFPLFRLGTLLARQVSAPLATYIKRQAREHPVVGRAVVMSAGRVCRAGQLRLRLWALRLPPPARPPPLPDRAAADLGADVIGELIVFALGAAIIVFEVNRQAMKQEMKVLEERSQWVSLLTTLEELQRELSLQQRDIERLQAALQRLQSSPHTIEQH